MKELVVIDACVRQRDSRTLRIAEPVIEALSSRYRTVTYRLPEMDGVVPLTPQLFAACGNKVLAPYFCMGLPCESRNNDNRKMK